MKYIQKYESYINENINFEIQKLKSLVFSELPTQEGAQEEEPQMKASEILKLLNS